MPAMLRAHLLRLRCMFLAFLLLTPAAASASGPLGPARFLHRQGGKTLTELLQAELANGRKRREGVIVMFTADWCAPCKEIKQFVAGSGVVRKALTKARVLYVDVDEWRGPAQQLIPGVDASKLPTLVRVGDDGKAVSKCFGTDLGLLSEDSVAHNLGRLLAGSLPDKPAYLDKPDAERALIGKHAEAQDARTKGVPLLQVAALGVKDGVRHVRLTIRNHGGPRRWYLIASRLDVPLSEHPTVRSWQDLRWTEHVRADLLHFTGSPDFVAIPVAGYGSVELADWPLPGSAKDGKIHVWELDRLALDGQEQTFQMKLPYDLRIAHPEQHAVARQGNAVKVEMRVRADHAVPIPK